MIINSSLFVRAASLFLLVILFQVLIARVKDLGKEPKRRFQHALTGHAFVQISYVLERNLAIGLLGFGAVGMFLVQTYFPTQFRQTFGPLLRPAELDGSQRLPGAFYFLLGTALTVALVDDWTIARYAVECLAMADPMASWIGSTIRSPKVLGLQGSSVSGCLACFGTAWLLGWLMLSTTTTNGFYTTVTLGALACTIAEALPYGNDNLNIPLLTALVVDTLG
jgi:dolichol kinase